MHHELPRHEKIRFRRDEITDLASLPSAATEMPQRRDWVAGNAARVLVAAAGSAVALILLAVAAVYAIGLSGIGSDRIQQAAEAALRQVAGVDVNVTMGTAYLTPGGMRFLALEVDDVRLSRRADDVEIASAEKVRLGLRLFPLLSGQVKVSSARLANARIATAELNSGPGPDWTKIFRNEQGLIEPELVARAIFTSVHKALDAVSAKALRRIALENVELVLPPGSKVAAVNLVEASLTETTGDSLSFSAALDVGGRLVQVDLSAERDDAAGRISSIELEASTPSEEDAAKPGTRLGAVDLKLTGIEGAGLQQGHLNVSMKAEGWGLDLGIRGVISGGAAIEAGYVTGTDRIEVRSLRTTVGRSRFDFRGLAGPIPAGMSEHKPGYRFELASVRSSIAPEGSPEPALGVGVRIAGLYHPEAGILTAEQIVLKGAGSGEALGTAALRFAPGMVPGLSVAFNVHDMAASQVKQLWPWFSARPAREWVLNNVFGGRVLEGELQVQVEPGRLGNGVPLNGDESFGRFRLQGTRFDTTGLIPPVRDATGEVSYRGADVDISLASGTVYLPSGRTVAASDGKLTIRKANIKPVIGSLDIDVEGEASAIAELASYDPINAMRQVGLEPADFTEGRVSGHVRADIPLHKGIDQKQLDWLVKLDYEDVSIAKPFDGQLVTEAKGSIAIEKVKAVIATKAKLNGIPAEIDAMEPLGGSEAERKRLITLTLDDKTRETVVPGLSGMIEGPVRVTVDARGSGERMIHADLTDAQLSIPWAGWSKGPGVAGNVTFMLKNEQGRSRLSEFKLGGETFGITGSLLLAGGSLSEASFSNVRLNRNDDVSVTVKRAGSGYAVAIKGKSLDARSVIKQFMSDSTTATKSSEGGSIGSVSLTVNVESAAGFHDEKLNNVELRYVGSTDRVDRLDVVANAASGARVEFSNRVSSGRRSMTMNSTDAGAVLRFLDLYEFMHGGRIDLALEGSLDAPMAGQVEARDFVLVDEPRLRSIVSTAPAGSDRSLNQAVRRNIDTSRVSFEKCYSRIEKGDGYLRLSDGILRGPLVGASFQGSLYDREGNMNMTGTFMPAYGLNRIFGELPLVGVLLGNGRDGGLIGVTFKLEGKTGSPDVQINPLSAIAPGIFRQIFEYR